MKLTKRNNTRTVKTYFFNVIKLIVVIIMPISCQSQSSSLIWVGTGGGTGLDRYTASTMDSLGNLYLVGNYAGTADLDPSFTIDNFTSIGSDEFFVTKLSNTGTYLWSKTFSNSPACDGFSIALDGDLNILITGAFSGTVDFDPGPSIANLSSIGFTNIFVCKLDNNGNYIWAHKIGNSSPLDFGRAIDVDASNNVYISGSFGSTVDFDPGLGTYNLSNTSGNTDPFILKLSSSGDFNWALNFPTSGSSSGYDIAINSLGEVYFAGGFFGSMEFDASGAGFSVSSFGSSDGFLAKYSSTGSFVWAKTIGGVEGDFSSAIELDLSGNVYVTGGFQETADFDPNAGVYNLFSAGSRDVFVWKLSSDGDFIWAKRFGGTSHDAGGLIDVDSSGNVYTTGRYRSTPADFDPGIGVANISSNGAHDIYISKLDSSGNFLCVETIGGAGWDYPFSLLVNQNSEVIISGYFSITVDFDPSIAVNNISSTGNYDYFVMNLALCNSLALPIELIYFQGIAESEGNQLFWETSSEINNDFFQIERSENGNDWENIGLVAGGGNSNQTLNYFFQDKNVQSTLSYYRLKQVDFNGDFEYSEVVSVKRNLDRETTIFPNPTSNCFEISPQGKWNKILIMNEQGKVVKEFLHTNQTSKFSTSNLDIGCYFIVMTRVCGEVEVRKLIKNR